jgi:AcrR family transcriptional regulator
MSEGERGYAKGRERREAILTAANEVFAAQGFRGASLASVATRVGLSEPGLLHHFRSKEELLLELLQLRHEHQLERTQRAMEQHTAFLDAMLELCRENERTPGLVRLFTILAAESVDADHPAHDWFLERYRQIRRGAVELLAEEQREGRIRSDLDLELAAAQIMAMFDGLQLQWLLDPGDVDMARAFEDFLARLRPAS